MVEGYLDGVQLRKLLYGIKLDRPTAIMPATAYGAIFNILGGRIILTGLVGEVTTVIQTQACNLSVVSTPTVGTAVALCAVLNVTAAEVGCLFGLDGTQATPLFSIPAGAGGTYVMAQRWALPIGTLGLLTSATNTGSIKWTITDVPRDDGAYVTVA